MNQETKEAFKAVIEYLDSIMENTPTRQVADTCNHLQELLDASSN